MWWRQSKYLLFRWRELLSLMVIKLKDKVTRESKMVDVSLSPTIPRVYTEYTCLSTSENQQDRYILSQPNQRQLRQYPNQENQKWKGRQNNRNWGNLKPHPIQLKKPILNKTGISGWTGQFSSQIPNTKVKSGADKWSKQSHNP